MTESIHLYVYFFFSINNNNNRIEQDYTNNSLFSCPSSRFVIFDFDLNIKICIRYSNIIIINPL